MTPIGKWRKKLLQDTPRIRLLKKRLRHLRFKTNKTTADWIGIDALEEAIHKEQTESHGGGGIGKDRKVWR